MIFGGTFRGPLILPKLYNGEQDFVFFSYEGFRTEKVARDPSTRSRAGNVPGRFQQMGQDSERLNSDHDLCSSTTTPSGLGVCSSALWLGTQFPRPRSHRHDAYLAFVREIWFANLPGPLTLLPAEGAATSSLGQRHGPKDHNLTSRTRCLLLHEGLEMRTRRDRRGARFALSLSRPSLPCGTAPSLTQLGWKLRMITPRTLSTLRYNKQKSMAFVTTRARMLPALIFIGCAAPT